MNYYSAGAKKITDIDTICTCKRGYDPKSACVFTCIEDSEDIENIDNTIGCYYEGSINEHVKPFGKCPQLQCKCHVGNDRLCRL